MTAISLSAVDLSLAAGLVICLALLSLKLRLNISSQMLVAALRTAIQLSLIGLVLKVLFANKHPAWVALMGLVMLAVAGREVMSRQKRRFKGFWGFGVGSVSMCISSFSITLFALLAVIGVSPWYEPQYAIPLLGMMLGNTMNGIALGLDRLTQTCWQQRSMLESRLMLGQTAAQAVSDIVRDRIRSGLTPIINSMAVAGLVSLPGMMTGQILAGNPPQEAVKYQIMIMFLIAAGTGFGTLVAVRIGARRLFDERQRLCLNRLRSSSD